MSSPCLLTRSAGLSVASCAGSSGFRDDFIKRPNCGNSLNVASSSCLLLLPAASRLTEETHQRHSVARILLMYPIDVILFSPFVILSKSGMIPNVPPFLWNNIEF